MTYLDSWLMSPQYCSSLPCFSKTSRSQMNSAMRTFSHQNKNKFIKTTLTCQHSYHDLLWSVLPSIVLWIQSFSGYKLLLIRLTRQPFGNTLEIIEILVFWMPLLLVVLCYLYVPTIERIINQIGSVSLAHISLVCFSKLYISETYYQCHHSPMERLVVGLHFQRGEISVIS